MTASLFGSQLDPLLGTQVHKLSLPDAQGDMHTLERYRNTKLIVLAFIGIECPLARLYIPRLAELATKYSTNDVVVLGINSNRQDTIVQLRAMALEGNVAFPFLKDAGNVFADQLGAQRTPEVFVIDEQRVVRYHGRIDGQYLLGVKFPLIGRPDLTVAIDELLDGRSVSEPSTQLSGCIISRVKRVPAKGDVTYTKHISQIIDQHCIACHGPNQTAPFPLTTYDEVANWAEMIREAIQLNRMPPWFANPRYGTYKNDCSLNEAAKHLFFTWLDNGCPEGERNNLPRPPTVTEWKIPTPGRIYEMAEEAIVPEQGRLEYRHFIVDPRVSEDLWVTAVEARPGNPRVVHHVILYAVPPGKTMRSLEEAQILGENIATYAAGLGPMQLPPRMGIRIAAGSQLVLQLHYTPIGSLQKDRSRVGLTLANRNAIDTQVINRPVLNWRFRIPANVADTVVTASETLTQDELVLSLYPHMHGRGESFTFEARYPDSSREILLDVLRYDSNWQLRYDLAKPKVLPKGTILTCVAHFDNSVDNLSNPNPNVDVRFGLQTDDEMMIGYYASAVKLDSQLGLFLPFKAIAAAVAASICLFATIYINRRSNGYRNALNWLCLRIPWLKLVLVLALLGLIVQLDPIRSRSLMNSVDVRTWTWRAYALDCGLMIAVLVGIKIRRSRSRLLDERE